MGFDRAAYMREWRRRKGLIKDQRERKPRQPRPRSDSDIELIVIQRGRLLTEMMRTPISMWPAEWTADLAGQELQMSDQPIVKVERNVLAYWKPAKLSTQYGGAVSYQSLPDDVRQSMGGEKIAYFYGKLENGKWKLFNRAPNQKW